LIYNSRVHEIQALRKMIVNKEININA